MAGFRTSLSDRPNQPEAHQHNNKPEPKERAGVEVSHDSLRVQPSAALVPAILRPLIPISEMGVGPLFGRKERLKRKNARELFSFRAE